MIGYGNSMFMRRKYVTVPGVDPDAQAFITAASITDPTQQSAINQLVVDLKGYNIWTKMKALYPFVGGSSTSHSYNLRNTAQHQITWVGGVTHASTGVTFNGTNGYGNTNLSPSSILTANSNHISVYSRTSAARTNAFAVDWGQGSSTGGDNSIFGTCRRSSNLALYYASNAAGAGGFTAANTDGSGMFVNSITSATSRKIYRNTTTLGTLTTNVSQTLSTFNVAIGALNANNVHQLYSNYQAAFFSIGDGLTDIEAANFYTAVQTFQTTLGRSIGTQTVSDADAQAFVTNAGIVDQVEANAINNLVIGLKADSLWTKMKAVYPMVGGSSSTMKYNLKNPLDTDAAFRLVFNGGWTFSSNGALPNGTNGYADTKLLASTQLSLNSTHVSVYSRTNLDRNAPSIGNLTGGASAEVSMWLRSGGNAFLRVNNPTGSSATSNDSRGLFIGNRNSSTQIDLSIRGTQTTFNQNSNSLSVNVMQLGGVSPNFFDTKELAFASIGDGLTSQNMTDLTTRVTTFQTALNRQVP